MQKHYTMKLTQNTIALGLPKPIRLFHTTDNHLCYADERDNLRKLRLAASRKRAFDGTTNRCLNFFHESIDFARHNADLHINTGDIIDFVSELNLDIVRAFIHADDCFFAVGNHEYSQYVGEAWEDHDYKMQSFDKVQAAYSNPLDFASRQIGGINLVAIDNGYYMFEPQHLAQLKQEVDRGLPIILMMHTPIFTQDLHDYAINVRKQPCAYLSGTPDDLIDTYKDDYRRRQQRPTPETREFIDYVKSCNAVKAVIAGHLHFNFETTLFGRIPQFVTGGGFHQTARLFLIN